MNDTVITAFIMAISSIVCQILINHNNRMKRIAEDAEKEKARAVDDARKETRLDDRLKAIESKLDEHNGYAQKFETVADKFTEVATDLSAIKTSIDFIREN